MATPDLLLLLQPGCTHLNRAAEILSLSVCLSVHPSIYPFGALKSVCSMAMSMYSSISFSTQHPDPTRRHNMTQILEFQPLLLLNFNPFYKCLKGWIIKTEFVLYLDTTIAEASRQRFEFHTFLCLILLSSPDASKATLPTWAIYLHVPLQPLFFFGNMQLKYPVTSAELCTSQLPQQIDTKYYICTLFQHNTRIALEINRGKGFCG